MNQLRVRAFGFAAGITGALLYLGCVLVMSVLGQQATVQFFNALLHGLDTASIIRMDVPLWEAGLGLVQTFFISWLVGACVAGIYNVTVAGSQPRREAD